MNKNIILFDGVCNLCNGAVQFIIKRDPKGIFQFAPLQAEIAQKMLRQRNTTPSKYDSMLLIQDDKVYTKSTAALKIAQQLIGIWRLLYVFIIVPRSLRDIVYDFIAANRYRFFGRSNQCMIPSKAIKARFIS
ncbi:MAG: thiol-disulfide oxidoreductase DCC family protein [Cytophagales bacterium]|nr:thiol-disulfide oxidoreductase DCC family protein [Cytophagales bacterium]